jgi:endonuclease/exonuclease/phosphatase family metal-dependent hydrolase
MRRHLAPLLALILGGCLQRALPKDTTIETTFPSTPTAHVLPRSLQVITFNVHGQSAANIARAIREDRNMRDADVIVLEEIHRDESVPQACSAACGLGKELGFYSIYAPGHAVGNGSDGVAIVSRAPITSAQVLELPFFNVHANSGRRVALAATVQLERTPITIYAVHLDNRLTVHDRRIQVMPVLEHANRQQTPVIIAGDFNTSPFTWIAHVLPVLTTTQDNRMEQLLRAYGFSTPVKDSGPTSRFLAMKLDGIYTRGFDTKAFATANARNISDHLALWATMQPAHADVTP